MPGHVTPRSYQSTSAQRSVGGALWHRICPAGCCPPRRAARWGASAAGLPRRAPHDPTIPDPGSTTPALGVLAAHARREHGDAAGLLYAIRLEDEGGRVLLDGRATIILTRP